MDRIVGGVRKPWCTSGYTVQLGSTRYMVTAGHCFNGLEAVYGGTGLSWGRVTGRRDWPNTDVELIGDTSYEGRIYTGTSSWAPVKGYVTSSIGSSPYCISGMAGGTHCDFEESRDNLTITFANGQKTTGLVELVGYGAVDGDSGAPAYATSNGNVYILGSVVGGPSSCSPIPSSCQVWIEPYYPRVYSVYSSAAIVTW